MMVKIADTWYSAGDIAMCIRLSSKDVANIVRTAESAKPDREILYSAVPEGTFSNAEELHEWMDDKIEIAGNKQ